VLGRVAGVGIEVAGEGSGGDDCELERRLGRIGFRGGHVKQNVTVDVAGLAHHELEGHGLVLEGGGRPGRPGREGGGIALGWDGAAQVEGEAALRVGEDGHAAVGRGDQDAGDGPAVEGIDDDGFEVLDGGWDFGLGFRLGVGLAGLNLGLEWGRGEAECVQAELEG